MDREPLSQLPRVGDLVRVWAKMSMPAPASPGQKDEALFLRGCLARVQFVRSGQRIDFTLLDAPPQIKALRSIGGRARVLACHLHHLYPVGELTDEDVRGLAKEALLDGA